MKKFILIALSLVCSQQIYAMEDSLVALSTTTVEDRIGQLGFNPDGYSLTAAAGWVMVTQNDRCIYTVTESTTDEEIRMAFVKHALTLNPAWQQREQTRKKHQLIYSCAGAGSAFLVGHVSTRLAKQQVPTGTKTITGWIGNGLSLIGAFVTAGIITHRTKDRHAKRNSTELNLLVDELSQDTDPVRVSKIIKNAQGLGEAPSQFISLLEETAIKLLRDRAATR